MRWSVFVFVGIALFLSGCSHKCALTYTPVIEKQPSNHIVISLNEIEDQRENKETIAYLRNIYFMPIGKVQSIQSPQSWISYAIETELNQAGYHVDIFEEADKYSITGDLYHLFIDSYLITRVNIKIGFSILEDEPIPY